MNHGWEYKRLLDVCDVYQPKTIPTKEFVENGSYDVFGANGKIGNYNKYNHENSEVLLGCRGTCGAVNHSTPKSWINGNAMVIHPNSKELTKSFLSKVLSSLDYSKIITGIAQPQITRMSLSFVEIPIPPLNVQHNVVDEFDKINKLIEAKRSQLADLDLLAQSLFYEMFGDSIENPKGWNTSELGECAEFKNGLNFVPADNGIRIKCLGVGDFKSRRYIGDDNLPYICIQDAVADDYLLESGDIIFVRSNGNKSLIGRSVLYNSDGASATFSGFCIRCRYDKTKFRSHFISYLLSSQSIRNHMISRGRGCNISNLNQKTLSSIPVVVPPIELQNLFSDRLQLIEAQKQQVQSSISDLETLLASRMDYWFND